MADPEEVMEAGKLLLQYLPIKGEKMEGPS
jgi:hypothetical protein